MSEFPPPEVQRLVGAIAAILRRRGETLAVSEAACGGLLSAYLVSVPGASDFYIGGKLLYSLKQRLKLSGWTQDDINNFMGPSQSVALKLARTTKYELGSTYVLSETGFAGPGTDLHLGSDSTQPEATERTVGTVYLGWCGPQVQSSAQFSTGLSSRSENMTEFAKLGLQFLLEQLQAIEEKEGKDDDKEDDKNEKDSKKDEKEA
ncbi:hypothetical protein DIURU_003205 [Diutina rugosa]|uniref:CinA C-terminal domain-containing protein n=1 Tax=Diutina rugosa TaxID=5481 RepID=A0A642UM13_DIURU|nr:uncharacterized protein DIURU_003205 [Diutina rugosa]KAA8901496.1 hypothetical protein DIURU_003205 [Diutina rugosa]